MRLRLGRGQLELAHRHRKHLVDLVERIVDLERVLEDGLHLTTKDLALASVHVVDDLWPWKRIAPSLGLIMPSSRRASVVLPLPLSPAMAMTVGFSSLMDSETSSTATVRPLRKQTAAKDLCHILRFQDFGIHDCAPIVQVAGDPPVRFDFFE